MTVAFWISTTFVTVLFSCYMAGATWNCFCLSVHSVYFSLYAIQPSTSLEWHSDSVWRHIRRVHVCLAATCTVSVSIMTGIFYVLLQYHRGGTDTKIKVGDRKLTLEKKILLPLLPWLKLQPLNHESSTLSLSYQCSVVVFIFNLFYKDLYIDWIRVCDLLRQERNEVLLWASWVTDTSMTKRKSSQSDLTWYVSSPGIAPKWSCVLIKNKSSQSMF